VLYSGVVGGGVRRVETKLETRWDHAEVFRETAPRLWSAIYAYSGGARSLTDDVVAEAFARALEHDREIREPEAWLYRTAFRLAASELRRRKHDVALVETSARADSSAVEVLLAMRKLSPGQRAAVFLHYQADLPIRAIARITGTSPATVKVQLNRGRARLRKLLSEDEEEGR
jgi:RNA polymerase sigma-70 factor (ECF subfamily)